MLNILLSFLTAENVGSEKRTSAKLIMFVVGLFSALQTIVASALMIFILINIFSRISSTAKYFFIILAVVAALFLLTIVIGTILIKSKRNNKK